MSESTRAVFLSYASQDAEAARRICETLRAEGVEVWFDADGGLEHGDEWDAKIRRQIKECVLFIPLISANTQAREEGYFRLEWDLAAERARTIASGVPFILPVVIDDTGEPDALVPDRFRTVQWTRLPGGVVTPEVKARYLKLWSHRAGLLKNEATKAERARGMQPRAIATEAVGKPGARSYVLIAAVAAVVVAAAGWWMLSGRNQSRPLPATRDDAAKAVPPPLLSETRQLVTKARALLDALDSTRDDFALAEDLLKQATAKDGADAEVWACISQVNNRYIIRGWEVTDQRRLAAQTAAQRALRLDPQSFEARFAQVGLGGDTPREIAESERELRALRSERPTDRRILQALGMALRKLNRQDEANAIYDESAALPGGDPLALYGKALDAWFLGRTAEAEANVRAAIAQKPFSSALLMSGWFKLFLRGDLDGALADFNQAPAWVYREDRGCYFAYVLHLFRGEHEAAMGALRVFPRDWINDNWARGPKGQWMGDALKLAGRTEAAMVEWRAALRKVDERLVNAPTDSGLLRTRVTLLAKLGERTEAERAWNVFSQLAGINLASEKPVPSAVASMLILLGRPAEAIRQISLGLKQERHAVDYTAASLRLDPRYAELRGEPEFAKVVAEAEALEKGVSIASLAPTPDAKSVAVLPFANQSADKDNEYFSDGIAEELLTVLQKIPGLKVAARTSAWSFKGKYPTAKEVGEKLGMAHVVEGSVQKAGNKVKITARLSRAATNEEVWSKSYGPLELTDVFATQSELATAIVGELRGRLTGEAAPALAEIKAQVLAATKGGTTNPEAHHAYLQGRFAYARGSSAEVARAIEHFDRAVASDGKFAQAWAAIARARVWQGSFEPLLTDRFRQARIAAENALAAEPDLAEAHSVLSLVMQRHFFDWRQARASSERAVQLAPNDPLVLSDACGIALTFGEWGRCFALGRQAVTLDPRNPEPRLYLAHGLFYGGQLAEAESEIRRMLELAPDSHWAWFISCQILLAAGRPQAALAEARNEPSRMHRLAGVALAAYACGLRQESDEALKAFAAEFADGSPFQLAEINTQRGDFDAAFKWLDHTWKIREPGVCLMRSASTLKNLHADPRWPALLKKIGMHDDQLK